MAHRFEQIQPTHCYTKQEVDTLIKDSIDEAMRKHKRNACIISMFVGFCSLLHFLMGSSEPLESSHRS